jgi:hypothetical protein
LDQCLSLSGRSESVDREVAAGSGKRVRQCEADAGCRTGNDRNVIAQHIFPMGKKRKIASAFFV